MAFHLKPETWHDPERRPVAGGQRPEGTTRLEGKGRRERKWGAEQDGNTDKRETAMYGCEGEGQAEWKGLRAVG